jgi:thiol-disulfide isomerase/thioredoxin
LKDANGEVVNMRQFQNKVLFINVWATWCPPCLAEMPNINQLYQELAEEDIVFVMLSVDQDFSKAATYVAGQDFQVPIYQAVGKWPAVLNSSTIPTTFVIDKTGRIVMEHQGMAKYNTKDFKAFLRGLL